LDTRNAKTTYIKYLDLSPLEKADKPSTAKSGLLTPTKVSDRMKNSNIEQPAYRVGKYVNSIRALNPKKNMVS
jgi:hypothetical protein